LDILISVTALFINNEEGQFRIFTTLQQEKGKGYGITLLDYPIQEAKNRGVKRIWCNTRENKVNFDKTLVLEEFNYRFTKDGKS
jgi:N-acetylglutamate synthase-like GNAT family acetyltransferase